MPLIPTTQVITADVKDALEKGLPSFRSADKTMQSALLATTHGLQVFTLGIPDVLPHGSGLRGATQSGWRIAVSKNGVAMAGDIYTMARGGKTPTRAGKPRLACVRQGHLIEAMLHALDALTSPPIARQLPPEPFNVHLLIMPGLYTEALWLQPQNPAASLSFVVPFYTLVDHVHLEHAYTEKEFIGLLQPLAEKWKSYKPRPRVNGRAAYVP